MAGVHSRPSPRQRPILSAKIDPSPKPSPATTNTAGAAGVGGDDMDDTRDRVIRVEERVKHMSERVDAIDSDMKQGFATMTAAIGKVDAKVDSLAGVLEAERAERQARDRVTMFGLQLGRWVALALAACAGALLSHIDLVLRVVKMLAGP